MAIPNTPQNFQASQANQQVALKWSLAAGATSYYVQRSIDQINYSTIATPTTTTYLDTTVTIGVMYYYQVASVNLSGVSPYSSPEIVVPSPTGELSLYELRLRSQQKADRVNSNFVLETEWNFFIDQSMYELYDLIVDVYEDYFLAPRIQFNTTGNTSAYALPNGSNTFINASTQQTFTPAPFYKLLGVDLGLNTANNAFVTVEKYNLIDRNRFVYPNTASTIYGVFNLRYRTLGTNIEFIPTPSSNQLMQLLYIPRLPALLQDTDMTTIGFSGWLQYVIIRAAKYALDKEESDTTKLDAELLFLKGRIEETASNRDAGKPDTISDTRSNSGYWGNGGSGGYGGPIGGF